MIIGKEFTPRTDTFYARVAPVRAKLENSGQVRVKLTHSGIGTLCRERFLVGEISQNGRKDGHQPFVVWVKEGKDSVIAVLEDRGGVAIITPSDFQAFTESGKLEMKTRQGSWATIMSEERAARELNGWFF